MSDTAGIFLIDKSDALTILFALQTLQKFAEGKADGADESTKARILNEVKELEARITAKLSSGDG